MYLFLNHFIFISIAKLKHYYIHNCYTLNNLYVSLRTNLKRRCSIWQLKGGNCEFCV